MTRPFDEPRIAAAVGFSPEELALNRQARLSERQRVLLSSVRRGSLIGTLIVGVIAIAFFVVVLVVVIPKATHGEHGAALRDSKRAVYGALAVVLVILLVFWTRAVIRFNRVASGRVKYVEGPARTKARRMPGNVTDGGAGPIYGGGMRYEVRIRKVTFFVRDPAVLDVFTAAGTYRAYYAAGGGKILNLLLSVERIA
jgi:hypothetical protein